MTEYKIFYADGTTYSGDPFLAPAWGVLIILNRDPDHGRTPVQSKDYYVYEDHRWWAVDFVGMIDYLARPGARRVLFGRLVSQDVWNKISAIALADPDLPPQTAQHSWENRP